MRNVVLYYCKTWKIKGHYHQGLEGLFELPHLAVVFKRASKILERVSGRITTHDAAQANHLLRVAQSAPATHPNMRI